LFVGLVRWFLGPGLGLVLVLTGVFLFVLHFVYAGFDISGAAAVSYLFF